MASIFSKIINKEIPSYTILENENFISFLDINPLTLGHCLVVPKKEIDYLFDLDDFFLSEILIFSKKISSSLIRTVDCNRVGVSVIGLEVPHAHVHLIPINNEKDMNFSNKRIEMSSEDFTDLQNRIIKNL
ncbi:MAG: HIT family protein [Bacteroidota bacterium]|nr:HIT family protein [Bacteroidota bacterium]